MKILGNIVVACLLAVATGAVVFFATRPGDVVADPESTSSRIFETSDKRPEPSAEGPHPKLVCDNPLFEFGRMELGTDRTHTFTLRNEGEADLVMKTGTPTCKCTAFELSKSVLKPGESCDVVLTWEPKSEDSNFSQRAPIHTNDPAIHPDQFWLTIEGSVATVVSTIPELVWGVGPISDTAPTKFEGVVHSRFLDEFTIADLKTNSPFLSVESHRVPEDDKRLVDNRLLCAYRLDVSVSPEVPVGQFEGEITYRIEGEGTRDTSVVYRLKVTGHRNGPIEMIPTFGVRYSEENKFVDIGQFSAAEGKTAKLFCFATHPKDGSEFEVTDITCKPSFLNVAFKKDESFKSETRDRYEVLISVPPGSPVGSRTASDSGNVIIKTNHPQAEELKLRVSFVAI